MTQTFLPKDYGSVTQLLSALKTKTEIYWIKRGEQRALLLFHQMAQRVPAYKDFLRKHKINPDKIKSIQDFSSLPTVDKNNYLRAYPREMLCWDGQFKEKSWVISTTSGSTGEPYYFPRTDEQDWQYALTAELYLRTNFEIHKKSTLYINGFAMGAWIGGLFTYQAIKYVAQSGNYKLSIINPGIFKKEIIKALKNVGHDFDQVIIGGYPPLIKNVIDEGIREGLEWKSFSLGFIFSAEGFSENFRDYIIKKTGLKNVYTSILNHYGTVDLGTMAHETPLSILARRLALKKTKIYHKLFPENKLPTLCQFIPEMFYFEENNSQLFCSAFSGIPLVRYDLKDQGGIYSLHSVLNIFKNEGIDLYVEAKNVDIDDSITNLPFVYVYERSDFIVKLYGANIYPETIRKALEDQDLQNYITGKFTLVIKNDVKQNQYLEINIELQPGITKEPNLEKKLGQLVVSQLLKDNSEYRSNYSEVPRRQIPKIVLWDYESPQYFSSSGKQKWIKK